MLHNPVYKGQVYALRNRSVRPQKRRGRTFGKSSVIQTPIEEWVSLPVKVEPAVVTEEEFDLVEERMKLNQIYSPRNAKHKYLLRGMVVCETHDGRVYRGVYNNKKFFVYTCNAYRNGISPQGECKRNVYGPSRRTPTS